MDITSITSVVSVAKDLIALLREYKALLPDSQEAKALMQKLEDAEKKLQEQQAMTAKELGYNLCQCTYPPQIMLYKCKQEHYECPRCHHHFDTKPKIVPSPYHYPPRW